MIERLLDLFAKYKIKEYRIVTHDIKEISKVYTYEQINTRHREATHQLVIFNKEEKYGFFKTKLINDRFISLLEYVIKKNYLSDGNLLIDNRVKSCNTITLNNTNDFKDIMDDKISFLELKKFIHITTLLDNRRKQYTDFNTSSFIEFVDKDNGRYISKLYESEIKLDKIRENLISFVSNLNRTKEFESGHYYLTARFLTFVLHYLVPCFNYINVKNSRTFLSNTNIGMRLFDDSLSVAIKPTHESGIDYEGNLVESFSVVTDGIITAFYGGIEDVDKSYVKPSCYYDYFLGYEKLYTPRFVVKTKCKKKEKAVYSVCGVNFQKTMFNYESGEISIYLQVKNEITGDAYETLYNGYIYDFFKNIVGKENLESIQLEEYIVDEMIVRLEK